MASIAFNKTRQQVTLNLNSGNSRTLMPIGSNDVQGPSDSVVLLSDEESSEDVQNALKSGKIGLRPMPEPVAVNPQSSPPSVVTEENENV
jgi:hypothetical protein